MKKNLLIAGISLTLLPSIVLAKGNANMNLIGNTDINTNDTFEVILNINNVENTVNGIVGIGGDLKYNNEYLECIEMKSINNAYEIQFNKSNHRIAGVDFTLTNGIKENTNIFKYTFKALKAGNTEISIINEELVDEDASEIKANISPLKININDIKEEVIVNEEVINKEIIENKSEIISNQNIKKEIKKTDNHKKQNKEVIISNQNIEENNKEEIKDNNDNEKKSPIVEFFVQLFNSIINIFKF